MITLFRKALAGAVALFLLAACHRVPLLTTPVTTTAKPAPPEPDPPVTTGVSEVLAQARRATISGVAYNLSLNIPAQKTEPIEVVGQVLFNLKDNRHPVQLGFKAPTSYLHSLAVNGQPVAIDHRNEHLVLPAAALKLGHNVAEIHLRAGEQSLNRNNDYLGDVSYVVPTVGLLAATRIPGPPAHSWQAVACSGQEIGTKGLMVAAKTMALTAIDLFADADLRAKAQAELKQKVGGHVYKPLPGDRKPALNYRD